MIDSYQNATGRAMGTPSGITLAVGGVAMAKKKICCQVRPQRTSSNLAGALEAKRKPAEFFTLTSLGS